MISKYTHRIPQWHAQYSNERPAESFPRNFIQMRNTILLIAIAAARCVNDDEHGMTTVYITI